MGAVRSKVDGIHVAKNRPEGGIKASKMSLVSHFGRARRRT